MTFEVFESVCRRFRRELLVEIGVAGDERYVHHRTAFFLYGSDVVILTVEIIVEQFRLLFVHLFELFKSAYFKHPLVNESRDVNAPAGRSVVHRIVFRHRLPVEHRRAVGTSVAEQVFADDNDGKSGRSHILLRSGVDNAELRNVNGLRHYAGRHIRNERNIAGVGNVRILRSVDRVVEADVDVGRVFSEAVARGLRDIREVIRLACCRLDDVAVLLRFFVRLAGELSGDYVVGFAAYGQKVERNRRELRGRAALQKQDFVVVGNIHDLAEVRFGLFDDCVVIRRSVAHLHDRHSRGPVANQILRSFFENGHWQHGRAC